MHMLNYNDDVMEAMSKETTEKITTSKNLTKEKMVEAIKTAKKETESLGKKNAVSIGVIQNNISEVIQKIESQIPIYMQLYSDLYTKYLHIMDNLYGTYFVSEMEFFDKAGIDKSMLGAFEMYWKSVTEMILKQIDMTTNFAKMYVQFRLATIDSYDKVSHLMMDDYTRAWNQFYLHNKK